MKRGKDMHKLPVTIWGFCQQGYHQIQALDSGIELGAKINLFFFIK
jgi:hypothetical protein